MAAETQEETQRFGDGNRTTALKAAAAAAATGAATIAARKALSHHDNGQSRERGESRSTRGSSRDERSSGSVLSSAASSAWDAAAGVLLPMAEEFAESAGKYVAENAPDVVRERIVPRFIEAFNEAA